MNPFDKYPDDGLKLLPNKTGANCRHEYGLKLQRLTRQISCAYCKVNLVDDYYHWLLLSVDHVIPAAECRRLAIPIEWCESYSNMVLCCSGCNGFKNKYCIPSDEPSGDWTLDRFFALRDRAFKDRKARILDRRSEGIRFFQSRPWEK